MVALGPLVKFTGLVLVCVSVFLSSLPGVGLLGLFLLGTAAAGRVGPFVSRRALRRLLLFGILLFVAQLVFTRQGAEIVHLPLLGLRVTELGVVNGLLMAGRFVICVSASLLFVATTGPDDLAYDLMLHGLPYRYGFTLVTMLRFMPLAGQESDTVRQALAARGIDLGRGGLRGFYATLRYWLLPVLVSSLDHVDTLAVSMEGRAFGLYPRRTFIRRPPRSPADPYLLGLATAICITAICL